MVTTLPLSWAKLFVALEGRNPKLETNELLKAADKWILTPTEHDLDKHFLMTVEDAVYNLGGYALILNT